MDELISHRFSRLLGQNEFIHGRPKSPDRDSRELTRVREWPWVDGRDWVTSDYSEIRRNVWDLSTLVNRVHRYPHSLFHNRLVG